MGLALRLGRTVRKCCAARTSASLMRCFCAHGREEAYPCSAPPPRGAAPVDFALSLHPQVLFPHHRLLPLQGNQKVLGNPEKSVHDQIST